MNVKNTLKWLGIAGATYLAGTAISNELFDTNFKTIGNWENGTWSGAQNTDQNIGAAISAATTAASTSAASATGASGASSLLGKVGTGLLDFAKSAGGGTILAGAVQGLAAGKAAEAQQAEERRYKRAFTPEEMAQINGAAAPGANSVGGFATGGYLNRARSVSDFLGERRQPAISGPTMTADQRAALARGG